MLYYNESAVLMNCYKEKLLLDLDKKKDLQFMIDHNLIPSEFLNYSVELMK